MKQYATILKKIKELTNANKPVPRWLADKVNTLVSRSEHAFKN